MGLRMKELTEQQKQILDKFKETTPEKQNQPKDKPEG